MAGCSLDRFTGWSWLFHIPNRFSHDLLWLAGCLLPLLLLLEESSLFVHFPGHQGGSIGRWADGATWRIHDSLIQSMYLQFFQRNPAGFSGTLADHANSMFLQCLAAWIVKKTAERPMSIEKLHWSSHACLGGAKVQPNASMFRDNASSRCTWSKKSCVDAVYI